MYSLVPPHVNGSGLSVTTGVGAVSVLPQTSLTTGRVVGAEASARHSAVPVVATGPPTSDGAVVCAIVYVYVQTNSRFAQSLYV